MDIQSYYIIVQEASQKLRSLGMICPEMKMEHIIIDKDTGEPCYALDLDKTEENRFHHSLRELDRIIDEMIGRKETLLPKTFKVYFDENFSKETPRGWIEKSKPENASKELDINGKIIGETDRFKTYGDMKTLSVESTKEPIEKRDAPVAEPQKKLSEIDKILNSYVTEKTLPDTYG